MRDQQVQFAENALEAFVLAALVAVPLFTIPFSELPFEEAKVSLLRAAALFGLPFFLFMRNRKIRRTNGRLVTDGGLLQKPLAGAALFFAYAHLVSALFSISPADSFFGTYLRRQGTFTSFCYLFFFLAVLSSVQTRKQIERLLFAVLITGFVAAFWAILQQFGLDASVGNNFKGRVSSTQGNPIFLSAFLIMTLPLHVYFMNRSVKTLGQRLRAGISLKRYFPDAAFFLLVLLFFTANLAAIMLARSRGPILGLLMGFFIIAILCNLQRGRIKATVAVIACGAGLLMIIVLLNFNDRPPQWLVQLPPLKDIVNSLHSRTGLVRAYIWQGIVDLLASNPLGFLVGSGPETLSFVLPKHNMSQLQFIENPAAIADRAHNEILDLLTMQGVLGLAAYLFVFGALNRLVLSRLGMIRSKKQHYTFAGFFIFGGLSGSLAFFALSGNPAFCGVGLGGGLVGGVILYLLYHALSVRKEACCPWHPNQLLLTLLLGALTAHFIELQFSFGVTATRLYFWVFSALVVVAGAQNAGESLTSAGQSRVRLFRASPTVPPAVLAGIAMTTVIFGYGSFFRIDSRFIFFTSVCCLSVVIACGIFLRLQLKNKAHPSNAQIPWVAAYAGLTVTMGIVYLISYKILEPDIALLLHPLFPDTMATVLQKNFKLVLYFAWILIFVFLESFSTAFAGHAGRNRNAAFHALWIFPLFTILSLPFVVVTSLKTPVADIYTRAGDELMRIRQWKAATDCFNKAVQIDPRQAWRYHKLGYLFFSRAREVPEPEKTLRYQEAMALVDKAAQMAQFDVTLKNNLARMSSAWSAEASDANMRFHRLKATEKFYAEALKSDPNNIYLWKESALIAVALGKIDEAVKRFEHVLEQRPNDFEAHRNLAFLYRDKALYMRALDHARAALNLSGEAEREEIVRFVTGLKERADTPPVGRGRLK